MTLNTLWFILIAVIYILFLFLEGFDFGVGMLLTGIGRKDIERRTVLNTIGPHWDGNEVWLLLAGGATFAAFPHWYATMFSGFYLGFFLLLVALILRGVTFEFRSKLANPRWRYGWDWAITFGSLVASFLLGVVFTNLVRGVPIGEGMHFTGTFFSLLNWVALLGGVTFVMLFLYHGANFLCLKLTDSLRARSHNASKTYFGLALVFTVGYFAALIFTPSAFSSKLVWSAILPVLAIASLLVSRVFMIGKKEGWGFLFSGLAIVFAAAAIFFALFPNVMISSTHELYNLNITNAASSPYTLKVMTIIAAIMVPVVILYQVWTYIVFRKRIKSDPKSLTY